MKRHLSAAALLFLICLSLVVSVSAQNFTEFAVPTPAAAPSNIIDGPSQKMWFLLEGIDRIGRISVNADASDAVNDIDVIRATGSGTGTPAGITYDPNSNLIWYTLPDLKKLATLPIDAAITATPNEIDLTSIDDVMETDDCGDVDNPTPSQIVSGKDGFIYFTMPAKNLIGKISIDKSICKTFTLPIMNSEPRGIIVGPDGEIWFTMFAANKLGRFERATETFTTFPEDANTAGGPTDIIIGSDGDIWYVASAANKIGHLIDEDEFEEFSVDDAGSATVQNLSIGPDGTPMWFTVGGDDRIGQITPKGTVKLLTQLSNGDEPFDIALGPDGNLWYSETNANNIVKIEPTDVLTFTTASALPDAYRDVAYSTSLTPTGGTPPYVISKAFAGGELPPGLTLSSDGVISGTPTIVSPEPYEFFVNIVDSELVENTLKFTINVLIPDLPDLSVSLSKTKIKNGALTSAATPINIGSQPVSSANVKFFLSKNAIRDSNDKEIFSKDTGELTAGKKGKKVSLRYKKSVPKKFKFLLSCIDPDSAISEQSESNNCDSANIPR